MTVIKYNEHYWEKLYYSRIIILKNEIKIITDCQETVCKQIE